MSNQTLSGKRYFEFSDEQKLAWLRLYRSQNVGPATFRDLISHFGTAAAALEALPELAKRGGAPSRITVFPEDGALKEIEALQRIGGRHICLGEPTYPPLLRQLEQAPPVLSIIGDTHGFAKPALAVVGSRNASISGLKITERLTSQVGEAGHLIVSGLARGIDTAAHRASLRSGTVAVFAGGLDYVFPQENVELARSIIENGGALVSEMPVHWQPKAQDFPRRNRIVTGLAQGVLVVEAAKRSGSLITARLANEAGRIVLAVPGSPLDPRSSGTNGLIREGATLVTSAEDIIEALTPMNPDQQEFVMDISEPETDNEVWESNASVFPAAPAEDLRERIISSLSASPVEVDDVLRFCDATQGEVQLVLLELTLAGRLQRHSGNRISLI